MDIVWGFFLSIFLDRVKVQEYIKNPLLYESSNMVERYVNKKSLIQMFSYIPKDWVIWNPFFVHECNKYLNRLYRGRGYKVLTPNYSIFEDEPIAYDIIVSAPILRTIDLYRYILQQLYEYDMCFALFLPSHVFHSPTFRYAWFKTFGDNVELLILVHTRERQPTGFWMCHQLLPEKLIFKDNDFEVDTRWTNLADQLLERYDLLKMGDTK